MDEAEKKRNTERHEKVERYLDELRVHSGLPETIYYPVVSILEAAREYDREKEERLTFAAERKRYGTRAELEALAHQASRDIIGNLNRLSPQAKTILFEAGFDMAQFLTLENALFHVPCAKLEKPGKGRPKELEKERLLDEMVVILRLHIGRIPENKDVENICEELFGERFSTENAVKRAYNKPWPSEALPLLILDNPWS